LSADGESGLTIEALSERAEVAPRTIYRGFGDKDGVIRAVMAEYMGRVDTAQIGRESGWTLSEIFDELDWMANELVRGGELARVMVEIYFSNGRKSPELLAVLRSVSRRRIEGWLEHAKATGILRPSIAREHVIIDHIDFEYVIYQRYTSGLIDRNRVALDLKINFLRTALLVTRDAERRGLVIRLGKLYKQL